MRKKGKRREKVKNGENGENGEELIIMMMMKVEEERKSYLAKIYGGRKMWGECVCFLFL